MSAIRWSSDASARLKRVPFFIRPFVKRRAEAAARAQGEAEVTSALLDQVKSSEHKPD
ncbi:MAG TPA: protochlorophyllide oxidoreductase [Polyangiaceae bacterium]|nr:protochlorophyllide oxidoreductase [Polyangiaceae bacterium]